MLLAGQNKYWGTVEEATQFWLTLGISHIMVKRTKDIKFVDSNGKVKEQDFMSLYKLQKKYKVKYHLHPYNLIVNGTPLTASLKNTQPILGQILTDLDRKVHLYGLYPLITIHLPSFAHPKFHLDLNERVVVENSKEFFQNLKLKSKLALENAFDPYKHHGCALLGYKSEHFLEFIRDKNFGLCIDIGHLNMQKEPLEKFLELPYPVYSFHLHGNDGTGDKHQLPTRKNVKDLENIVKALRKCKGPIVLEIRNYDYRQDEIKQCISFWKKLVSGV